MLGVASCGGPYVPKKMNVAGDKLGMADRLFAKGKYGDAALEYKDFLASFAGDERCDYAQFRLGESYRMNGEYALAEVEYRILINDYAYSEYVDDAFFLEGLCSFKESPQVERDQTKTEEALDRLTRFVQTFPKSPRLPEAQEALREVRAKLGHKEFINAQLYYSRKHYDAALVYLNKIIDRYPDTVWAARSRFYRGAIEEARGDAAGAVEDYQAAVAVQDNFPEKSKAVERLKGMHAGSEGVPKGDGG